MKTKSRLNRFRVWLSHTMYAVITFIQRGYKTLVCLTAAIYIPILIISNMYYLLIEQDFLMSVSAVLSLYFMVNVFRIYQAL